MKFFILFQVIEKLRDLAINILKYNNITRYNIQRQIKFIVNDFYA